MTAAVPDPFPMMPQRARSAILVLSLFIAGPAGAAGSTVYKVVDPQGNITYQDQPPEPGTPDVQRLEVKSDQNVLKSTPPAAPAAPPASDASTAPDEDIGASAEQRRREAAAIVRKALEAEEAAGPEAAGEPAAQPVRKPLPGSP